MWFAAVLVMGAVTAATPPASNTSAPRMRYAAIAFDALVLFNPDSVASVAEREFPGKGRALTDIWRTRQFEYSWLRSIAGRYVDFWTLTEDALMYAGHALQLEMTRPTKQRLMDAYLRLEPWPDTERGLRQLRDAGIRIVTVTNFSPAMLEANEAGNSAHWVLSADGKPTVWVNRLGQPAEELGFQPDRTVRDLNGLLDFVLPDTKWPRTRH